MHESNRILTRPALVLVLLALVSVAPLYAQPEEAPPEEEAVLDVVQAVFDAIGARDTTAFRALQLPEVQAIAIGVQGGRIPYTVVPDRDACPPSPLGPPK